MKWKNEWIDNEIEDEGAKTISESLKINTSLTELYLNGDEKIRKEERTKWKEMKEWIDNKIGDEGAKSISEALKINTSLNTLILGSVFDGNQIGTEGAKAISESLKINTSLTSLNVRGDEKIRNEKRRNEMKWSMSREQNRRWRS